MVGPVSFNTASAGVHFRGDDNFSDLVNQKGPYTQAPDGTDIVDLSGKKAKKKGKFGKILLSVLGAAVVVGGALFGLYKWKGGSWINQEAAGFMPKIKNALGVAGKWVDEKVVKGVADLAKKIPNMFKKAEKAAASAAESATGAAEEVATHMP